MIDAQKLPKQNKLEGKNKRFHRQIFKSKWQAERNTVSKKKKKNQKRRNRRGFVFFCISFNLPTLDLRWVPFNKVLIRYQKSLKDTHKQLAQCYKNPVRKNKQFLAFFFLSSLLHILFQSSDCLASSSISRHNCYSTLSTKNKRYRSNVTAWWPRQWQMKCF